MGGKWSTLIIVNVVVYAHEKDNLTSVTRIRLTGKCWTDELDVRPSLPVCQIPLGTPLSTSC
jgi:hypothetical protein